MTDLRRRGIPCAVLLVAEGELPATPNLGVREQASAVAALAVAWGVVRRRPLVAAAGLGAGVALNRYPFALLHERRHDVWSVNATASSYPLSYIG